ncbi:uncharacterized protein BX664DRAFT_330549 [Halteromyces radiatus]|uniref:uncharacterized protein n=1 Tax=Halteromyces radiatus TaxID=101107 RepID=UPI00221EB659|nr:uncharacterized protein BX664DRAFT_330549 [Halteromyces radiatus]KAI8093779.1 hypothetical protein BX664DRAFT_330549 [Halteromyces radiatus]
MHDKSSIPFLLNNETRTTNLLKDNLPIKRQRQTTKEQDEKPLVNNDKSLLLSPRSLSPSSKIEEEPNDTFEKLETSLPEQGRSKRKRKQINYRFPLYDSTDILKPGRRQISSESPRWHTQSYIMLLALREQPGCCLARTPLINAAVAMDEKISRERNLPRVFRGKTPKNSASAVLTTNTERYFVGFKPEGSRSTHFRLAYTPGNFDSAYAEYKKWMEKLVGHDWLYCFGIPLPKDDIINNTEENGEDTTLITQPLMTTDTISLSPMTMKDTIDEKENSNNQDTSKVETTIKEEGHTSSSDPPQSLAFTTASSPSSSSSQQESSKVQKPEETQTEKVEQPIYQLHELDLSNVPTSLRDIVRVDISTIPNAGQGLFATRKLPYNSPLGFYFGVPMTEFEFDSLKEHVGRASEYSIMYRKTVLDATDETGEPYLSKTEEEEKIMAVPDQRLCPFHYMNEANDQELANIIFVEGTVVNQIICWTRRDIEPGEELLVWYGADVNRYWSEYKKQHET